MELTRAEEDGLDGKHGESLATAYRILAAIGEATGAEKLVPIKWAHLSGVNYNTIGEAGSKFLEKFSKTAKAAVRTTLNPMGYDRTRDDGIPESFKEGQKSITSSYERMGVIPSYTCVPYELFEIPRGTAISFAESSAAVYSNSLLGLRTNKESALSALASSLTGKAPLSDLRAEEARKPKISITVDLDLRNELDYGLMGYYVGKVVKESSVSIDGISKPSRIEAKALCAGIGTSGSCGMFAINRGGSEGISFGRREASAVTDELSTADDGDIITLGSPQFGLGELELLSAHVNGREFTKRCIVFCSRAIHDQAAKIGLAGRIQRAGGEFMCDCCTCLTPYVNKERYDSVIANSAKAAYYLNKSNGVKVALKDIATIAKEYTK